MQARKSFAQIGTMFKKFVIVHPRATAAMLFMEDLREWKRLSDWRTEAPGAFLLAPSQSGKTHTVTTGYNDRYLLPELRASDRYSAHVPDDHILKLQKQVVYVKLPAKPQLGATATAILKALEHTDPHKGTVGQRLHYVETLLANGKVELLILDSYDHLTKTTNKRTEAEATETQDTLKLLMEQGTPMLFVGLPDAKDDILGDKQLKHRMFEIEFSPLSPENEEDIESFTNYLKELDILMCCNGIFPDSSDLFEEKTRTNLFFSCRGQYGVLSNIVRDAAILSSSRGGRRIEVEHLKAAVDTMVSKKLLTFNTFAPPTEIDVRRAA